MCCSDVEAIILLMVHSIQLNEKWLKQKANRKRNGVYIYVFVYVYIAENKIDTYLSAVAETAIRHSCIQLWASSTKHYTTFVNTSVQSFASLQPFFWCCVFVSFQFSSNDFTCCQPIFVVFVVVIDATIHRMAKEVISSFSLSLCVCTLIKNERKLKTS